MNKKKKYQGVVVPAITPLTATRDLDEGAVERLFDRFRSKGAMPFILGTTGEAASLPLAVKQDYIRKAGKLKQAGEMLYAGIGGNCVRDSIELARFAFGEGVDVVVSTLPSYYTLTEAQMKKYFEQLAEQCGGPLMIYNIPATTHQSIPLGLIDELSHHPAIVGAKDSERGEERLNESLRLWAGRSDFSHFLGWAAKSAHSLLNGGDGLVPSTGNLDPGIYQEMVAAAGAGDRERLLLLQERSDALGNSYQAGRTLGESLAALKLMMEKEGICQHYMMPPL